MSKICDALKNWDKLTLDEKMEFLKDISEEYLKKFGLDQSELQYKTKLNNDDINAELRGLEAKYGLPIGTWGKKEFDDIYHNKDFDIDKNYGHYFEYAGVLFVNPNELNNSEDAMTEGIDTIYHETQHYIDNKFGIKAEEQSTHIGFEDKENETSVESTEDQVKTPDGYTPFHQRVHDLGKALAKEKKDECKKEKPKDDGYGSSSSVPELDLGREGDEDYENQQSRDAGEEEEDEEMDEEFGMSISK
jgi:hypothetical protein